jgi:DNA-binding Xre family transcriptional regulator
MIVLAKHCTMEIVHPRDLLAAALKRVATSSTAAVEIADRAGTDMRRQVFRARAGKPVNAGAFLALCGALGIDPADGSSRAPRQVSSKFSWPMLAAGLRVARRLRHHDQRSAARVIGVSAATLCRAEAGDAVSVESLLAICRFIGTHPENYLEQVSRETGAETGNVDLKGETKSLAQRMSEGACA